jgi:hypothetical protein
MKVLKAIWRAVLRFFTRKTSKQKLDQVVFDRSEKQAQNNSARPKHNNRKRTRGRVIQEIIFDGGVKHIHHPVSFRQF